MIKLIIGRISINWKIRTGHRFRKYIRNAYDRLRLGKNTDFSIISNHCMGGIISHDLGVEFKSPTVNLKILPDDFIKFVENLEHYLYFPIVEKFEEGINYPIGSLGDITLYFVHYSSFAEAVKCWDRRKERVNLNNVKVMMTIRDGCSLDTIERYMKLSYDKVVFANDPISNCEVAICSRMPDGSYLPGYISDVINIWGKRGYQCGGFDYVKFLKKIIQEDCKLFINGGNCWS